MKLCVAKTYIYAYFAIFPKFGLDMKVTEYFSLFPFSFPFEFSMCKQHSKLNNLLERNPSTHDA